MSKTRIDTKQTSKRKRAAGTDALGILDRVTGDDPTLRARIEEATVNAHVAQLIYDARVAAGLTQSQLAALIGSTQPVIARLEDADYLGHSLSLLRRIADALGLRIRIDLVATSDRNGHTS